MLEDLIYIHQQVLPLIPTHQVRYLFDQVNWKDQSICILGGRGVGKTTLICQALLKYYPSIDEGLYLSADNAHVLSQGLFEIAREYFSLGGRALFIDEVHKYPDWEQTIKNLIDTYRDRQFIFSGSSSLDLKNSQYDLSRRVVYYELRGLSFREYLDFANIIQVPRVTLDDILTKHMQLSEQLRGLTILKHFSHYLMRGYFPFFLEGEPSYLSKLSNVIEKVISEDIAFVYNVKQTTLPLLKKLLWLVATANSGLFPNIDRISKDLRVSREGIYNAFMYLEKAGLLRNIHEDATDSN